MIYISSDRGPGATPPWPWGSCRDPDPGSDLELSYSLLITQATISKLPSLNLRFLLAKCGHRPQGTVMKTGSESFLHRP